MSYRDVTREAVLSALAEFDKLGRAEFLSRYGYGEAVGYYVVHEGRRFDSKAIVGAAHGFLTGRKPLPPSAFSGGAATVVP